MLALTVLAGIVAAPGLQYPETKTVDVTDSYHGTVVADPYRWLEEPIENPEVKAWVDAQNKVTDGYLKSIPNRDGLMKELLRRVNYERFSVPAQGGDTLVYERNSGVQNQDPIYVLRGRTEKVLLDPNKLSKDGTVGVVTTELSHKGDLLLYGLTRGGSDWIEWRVRNTRTGRDLKDVVKWSKFGVGFLDAEGKGMYYLRFPEPKKGEELTGFTVGGAAYYHKFGTDQKQDQLIYGLPDKPDWFIAPYADPEKKTLFLAVEPAGKPTNRLYAIDLTKSGAKIRPLFDQDDGNYAAIGRKGDWVYVQATRNAPRGKVIAVSLSKPGMVKEIIPQGKNKMESVSYVGGHLVVNSLEDAHSKVEIYTTAGVKKHTVRLPGLGTASSMSGDPRESFAYFSYADFFTPTTIFKLNVATGMTTVWKRPKTAVDSSKYTAKQVFFTSKDGTKVPMFVVHKKGLKMDGTNPTLLYGYGGFNSSQLPWFSTSRSVWMDMGGVWCLANIRGGGEYGEAWWQAAIKTKRQKAYDDFIAAGEWLVKNKVTQPKMLAIQGGSNGGLLVGACMTQRPDLFGVAIPEVGVMDMLRFNQFTVGKAWESDYGSPQNPEEFKALLKISPYHNLKKGTKYPATLVTTADRDDRVVPAHSFKFAAMLQATHEGDAPVLLRVETTSGHGASNLTKALEGVRDVYSFTMHNMGRKIPAKF